jgi:hypothetical protein
MLPFAAPVMLSRQISMLASANARKLKKNFRGRTEDSEQEHPPLLSFSPPRQQSLSMFTSIMAVTSVLAAVSVGILFAAAAFFSTQGVSKGKWSHHHGVSRDGLRTEDSRDYADPVPALAKRDTSLQG